MMNRRFLVAMLIVLALVTPVIMASTFGNLVSSSTIRSTTYIKVGTFHRLTERTAISVTTDGAVDPTGSYQQLTASEAVQTSDVTCGSEGDIVIYANTVNQTITLTDTGALKLTGNFAMGQYDTLTVLNDGTNCLEIARSNN